MNPEPPLPSATPEPTPARWTSFPWLLFLGAILGPPLLTTLAASMDRKGGAAPALMFLGGAAGGLAAGVMLGCRIGKTPTTKALWSVVLAGVLAVAVVTLSGLGCAMGGYKLNFQ